MPWVDTSTLDRKALNSSDNQQVYCGLDSAVTVEVLGELRQLFNQPPAIYNFERALQAPYLEMMQRGWLVDELSRRAASTMLRERLEHLLQKFHLLTSAICDRTINPASPKQLKELLYDSMRLPEQQISFKGTRRVSTNREALEKLEVYLYARPLVSLILSIRDIEKQLSVLETEIDSDSRFRTSYNIAGTETGRPSSSENAFGTGGNAQNISPALRFVLIADPGMRLCQIDLEQVEARDVGWFEGVLFDDWRFLNACESGDLHTNNSKLIWPELPWTGRAGEDRKIAERLFYRDFSYRDMAKRGSHLSNYSGTAWTASRALKVPLGIMEEFQARYCRGRAVEQRTGLGAIEPAYPGHPRYWQWVSQQIQTIGWLTTPFGRKRHFFGRQDSGETLREAIAYLPQSTTADRMNLGLWRCWKYMPEIQLLGQGFDSITFQFDEGLSVDKVVGRALELIRVELKHAGRSYIVPGEAKIGWNWGVVVTPEDVARAKTANKRLSRLNPDGLIKWKPGIKDSRQRATGLKRIMT